MSVKFETMSDADYQMYLRRAIPQYAYDQAHCGNWKSDESVGQARAEFLQTLPNGPQTERHFLVTIIETDKGSKVGMMWWAMNQRGDHKIAVLADFFIFSESRRKGYEVEALTSLMEEAGRLGAERIELQVFAHNSDDITMYKENGFKEASIYFGKDITK
jgi:GNAT superfamily N-acetyltransferase